MEAYIQKIKGSPYMSKKALSEMTGISTRTIENKIKGIAKLSGKGKRYSEYAIIDDGIVMINVYAFFDYCKYRKQLEDKNMSKYVPKFVPAEIAQLMCWGLARKEGA